jgi:transglutaminase-like putative cysteine protease
MSSPAKQHTVASDLIASLMVAAFSMTVAIGYARVFSGWPFLTDMAIVVVVGHGVGLVFRRLGITPWIAVPFTALALAWTVLAVFYPETFSWAMPSDDTWAILQSELTSVRDEFRTAIAPVEYAGGWNLLAAIGLATAVLLADVFAFRADARAETLVPGGVLFVFVGALGDERLRIASAVLLVGVGVVTTVSLRWYHAEPGRSSNAAPWRRWPVAVAFGVIVALIAGVVGPRLPGADAAPLYDTGGGGGSVTQVISPLVDIRSRLTNRSTEELFRVRADAESYWRSSALPEFDGTTWGLPERDLEPVDGAGGPADGAMSENRQQITIGALGGTLVPAAPDPLQASPTERLRWVPETSTLVTVDGRLQTGDVIDIVSASPRLDQNVLSAATSTDAGDPIYTSLPTNLPDVVAATARQVTSGARTPYEAALLTQAWFQSEFVYSLEVQPGHGNSAIESFLRDRVGYCEQFAGTYAAMMRTIGIPARVAVGFTSGVRVGEGDYSVLGRNAHAWPEVWFDGIGWVAFEPTPGRGAPNAENYTGLPARQDTSATADDLDISGRTPTTTVPTGPDSEGPGLEIPDLADLTPADGSSGGATPTGAADSGGGLSWGWLALVALIAVVLAAPLLVRSVRSRRLPRSVDLQVAEAWRRATRSVSAAGVPLRSCDTPLEVAASTARHFPVVTRPMASLAEAVTEATYRAEGTAGYETAGTYGASTLNDCRNWAKQIDRAATESLDWQSRLRQYFTNFG